MANTLIKQKKRYLKPELTIRAKTDRNNEALIRNSNSELKFKFITDPAIKVEYETRETLLHKSHTKNRSSEYIGLKEKSFKLSPAMREYFDSNAFSPDLENKKISNLDTFFLEKYQLMNGYLEKKHGFKHFKPIKLKKSVFKRQTDEERKMTIIENKIKSKSLDPFKRKLFIVDKLIKDEIKSEMHQQKSKEESFQKTVSIIEYRCTEKDYIPPHKRFIRLNLKAKMMLQRIDEGFKQINLNCYK